MAETINQDEELHYFIHGSKQECARCGDHIMYTDEVYLLSVVNAEFTPEGTAYVPVQSDEGDFLYQPRFFQFECWEEVIELLREALEEYGVSPVEDMYSVLECSACGSGIRQEESLAIVTFGEVHCSSRSPNSNNAETFTSMDGEPAILCLSCLRYISSTICSMWEGEVQEDDECEQGTFWRCWRTGCPGGAHCRARKA